MLSVEGRVGNMGSKTEAQRTIEAMMTPLVGVDCSKWSTQQDIFVKYFDYAYDRITETLKSIAKPKNMEAFRKLCFDRYQEGYVEYGDGIFTQSPKAVQDEQLQELADAVIYGIVIRFMIDQKLEHLYESGETE